MDHSNSELFTNGYDTFLLDSSSPPLVADPGPTDAPPLSGDVFDPSSLDGSGFDGLGSQQRPPELLLMEDIGPTQVEEMDLGMPEQMGSGVQKVTAPDTFIADDSLHNSSAYGLEDFMGGPCTEEHNAGPGFQEPPSGNMFDDVGTEAGTGFHFNPNQLEEPSILARIGALEAKY
ncbi:hypothetical protein CEP54_000275 [Fusarium duplospermum]|uniref:Uncharacterized protein n=1 Tax=Fusarium duplospermum TaxID=1325734 RepID=A0A428R8M5_9HYPO|nr:hypothetical protein CEP54_000275 [Fusarium duplospermum]